MRRKEFAVDEQQEIDQFLGEMSFGILATVAESGYPSATPLNYVYTNGNIYFHGSRAGEKIANLKAQPYVTFCVAKEYAIIPSYFTDPELACPATAFFKSVVIAGRASLVEDITEKAAALQALMVKLQPEGGHKPILADDPAYRGNVKGVAVVRIDVEHLTAKFKFAQNKNEEEKAPIVEGLRERGGELDSETIGLMQKYCPYHNGSSE
ncbi:pyridoxamine 5'-phosphate oxidase family protein [Paenibacillus radicis (ex Gao et al. 2016)]|uniref:Nitroimidazole resistance protein n=1 Tax=Paenibacillus radicis (ex Gao et al. 2016) TaxID=1737354 RepID=A0A917LQT1_9BACL|nr:pyridoxamine 5'-phosphate oxidase family protein [Paenibacillus radicis (ex Gao et al. 2016)]GGG51533.1 nitroimidazole resistance protein [Paenibacillus radicis (ex Gao et al. 2016)]